jgi:mono/diheme cytochrome c family protein
MKRVLFVVLGLGLGLILLAACGSGSSRGIETLETIPADYAGLTNPLGPEAVVDGAAVFKTNCESCHGVQGHGDGPAGAVLDPAPKNLAELQPLAGDDYLFWRISTGKPGTAMIAWKGILDDEQIWQTVTFIRSLK